MRLRIAGFFVAAWVMAGGMTPAGTSATPERKSGGAPRAAAVHGMAAVNPHLHGVKPVTVKAVNVPAGPAVKGPTAAPAGAHGLWRNGWDVLEWRTNHLRYGKVEGVLVDASGNALADKQVWLRYASGHPVHHHWEAHVTHTDASGHFSMSHVIAKEYRLCAKVHGKLTHEQIQVRPGVLVFERLAFP